MPSGLRPSQPGSSPRAGPARPLLSTPAASAGAACASRRVCADRSAVSLAIERRRHPRSAAASFYQRNPLLGAGLLAARLRRAAPPGAPCRCSRRPTCGRAPAADRGAERAAGSPPRRRRPRSRRAARRPARPGRRPPEVGEHAGRLVRRERREHREPERAADLLRRVEQARGQPGVLVADVRRGDQRDRDEGQAHADRLRDDAGQDVAQVRAVDGHAARTGRGRRPR